VIGGFFFAAVTRRFVFPHSDSLIRFIFTSIYTTRLKHADLSLLRSLFSASNYGYPLSVSRRPCFIVPMFFIYFFMAALFSGPG